MSGEEINIKKEETLEEILIGAMSPLDALEEGQKGGNDGSGGGILADVNPSDSLEKNMKDEIEVLASKLGPVKTKKGDEDSFNMESRFKIWAGIPGTGKSYNLMKAVEKLVNNPKEDVVRTVFHPEYSNYDFIGQIKPTESGGVITYPFVSGPFTTALKKAHEGRGEGEKKIVLIIEELNRGNASAIFGEIFQLLDIDSNGESTYGIWNRDMAKVLGLGESEDIRIPSNLYIYATMNISDQNVFPLDTAFLRRWDRDYLPTDDWCEPANEWIIKLKSEEIPWEKFATVINDWLIENAESLGIEHPEDKRLGPWFVEKRHCEDYVLFANKVIVYLWTNVFCHTESREQTFSSKCNSLEKLLKEFKENGSQAFRTDLSQRMSEDIEE
jgi:hypothetical protein